MPSRVLGRLLLVGAGICALGGTAFAQGAACPPGNLLAGKRPDRWFDIRGDLALVTNNEVAPEGALWNAPPAIVLETGAASLTYDLGAVTTVNAVYVQADNNDTYRVWASVDGKDYKLAATIGRVDIGQGLRARRVGTGGVQARFLRFGDGVGDNAYSLSELQAFCQVPDPFPPALKVVNAPLPVVKKTLYDYWNNETSARWELILALLGLALLGWRTYFKTVLPRRTWLRMYWGRERHRKLRDRLLMVLGILSLGTYFNFGSFHFGNVIHDWEWTHYYVGSKYFRELGYDRLYECIAVADSEESTEMRHRVELRKLTNLRNNVLEKTTDVLAHPERCKEHFTAERWESFRHDVRFFRNRQSAQRWDDLQTDHGYNGTPVWNIAGTILSNTGPASTRQLYTLAMLDPLYLLAMVGLVWWAFGWRTTCVGLLVFATNFPSRFYWTGGAFLRWDWLFYTVGAVCFLKKGKPMLGGMALGYAALLRVFPVFAFLGPALAAGWVLVRERRLPQSWFQFFAGAALAACILVPASLQTGGGVAAYRQFIQNTVKHKETPLTNYMGLRTVIAYRPSEVGRLLRNDKLEDPWSKWKQARLRGFREGRALYAVITLGFVVLLAFAVRGRPPWVAVALSTTFIAVGVELTCYYYAFIMAVALLYKEDQRVGTMLLLLTAFTQFVDWRPIATMPGWLDEQYTLMSVGTLIAFGVMLWDFGLGPWLAARAAGTPVDLAPAGVPEETPSAAPTLAAGAGSRRKKKKRR